MIRISTDKDKLDISFIHKFLTNTYWAKGRTLEEVKTTIENSFCFWNLYQWKADRICKSGDRLRRFCVYYGCFYCGRTARKRIFVTADG